MDQRIFTLWLEAHPEEVQDALHICCGGGAWDGQFALPSEDYRLDYDLTSDEACG